jgi:hypothetical protein
VTLVHWHHSKVYKKLTNNFEVMPHVLMTLSTEGHGELGYYYPVVLDDKIISVFIIVITSMAISILTTVVLLRVLRRCDLIIVFIVA